MLQPASRPPPNSTPHCRERLEMVRAGDLVEKGKLIAGGEAMEEKERSLIEASMAERYTIPAEVFSAGSVEDCVRVSSLEGFNLTVDKDCASLYLMPYLPLRDAAKIQQVVEARRLWLLVLNPELLPSKVSILKAIEEQIRMLESRQDDDKLDNRNKENDGRLPVKWH
ncbi:hypothetical protein PR202_ga04139 [Eleusine coracana subsp. coracana]|uniref:Uncharacterized protein n=1 Tax=Eleusine coracana subsp. coracana TaxID=191504 RepID=A0AAV5BQB8_ELECO|nr:hypothetical protein PR202_ga04139 [Eleusine coracana subsp. coracana]